MLNYELTAKQVTNLYKGLTTAEERAAIRERLENPPAGENTIAMLRDAAQKAVDNGNGRYRRILRALEA